MRAITEERFYFRAVYDILCAPPEKVLSRCAAADSVQMGLSMSFEKSTKNRAKRCSNADSKISIIADILEFPAIIKLFLLFKELHNWGNCEISCARPISAKNENKTISFSNIGCVGILIEFAPNQIGGCWLSRIQEENLKRNCCALREDSWTFSFNTRSTIAFTVINRTAWLFIKFVVM